MKKKIIISLGIVVAVVVVAVIVLVANLGRIVNSKKDALLASQVIQAGYCFCTQSPAEALFWLPDDKAYDISVTFPGGSVATKSGVKPGAITIEKKK